MPDAELIVAVTAVAISMFAFGISWIQTTSQIRSNQVQRLFYLHQYLAQKEFADARREVRQTLYQVDYQLWEPDDRALADKVCASYDQAGIILLSDMICKQDRAYFLGSSWGRSICDQYEALSPYLRDRQASGSSGEAFFSHFKDLYREAGEFHRKAQDG